MDIDALDELLGKYLLPLITTDWKQFLLNALPSIVTVITIITSSVLQSNAAKRESERQSAQNEHTLKLERERNEYELRSKLLEKQVEEIRSRHSQMLALYHPMSDALCDLALDQNTLQACATISSNARKLLAISEPHSSLNIASYALMEYLDSHVLSDIGNAHNHFLHIRDSVAALSSAIFEESFNPAMLEETTQTETQKP